MGLLGVDSENFVTLSKECETLTTQLARSADPKTRVLLLVQLRTNLSKLDRIVLQENPDLIQVVATHDVLTDFALHRAEIDE